MNNAICAHCLNEYKRSKGQRVGRISFCTEGCKALYLDLMEYKTCNGCNRQKLLESYSKNKNSWDGYSARCKKCVADHWQIWYNSNTTLKKEKNRLANKKFYDSSDEEYLFRRRLQRYNLSIEDYNILFERSNGVCEICKRTEATCIDHDHKTNEVRGLLCDRCNLMIGMAEDKIELLISAIKYLEQ